MDGLARGRGTLGVHYQTAYAWVREGVLPARKVGRGYEISAADARALAARRRQGAQPATPIHVRDWAAQSLRLYEALAAGDETLARQRLSQLAGGVPLIDLARMSSARPWAGSGTTGRPAGSRSRRSTGPAPSASG